MSRKKNYAILISAKKRPGGIERRFFRIFLNLIEKNEPCYLFAFKTFIEDLKSESQTEIPNIVMLPHIKRIFLIFQCLHIIYVCKRMKISSIHIAANPSVLSSIMVVLGRFFSIDISVSSVASSQITKKDFKLINRICIMITYYLVKRIDFLSDSIYYHHSKIWKIDKKKVFISPCSFMSRLVIDEKHVINNNRAIDICFVSRLTPHKGFELLIDTLIGIENCLNIRICGEGPLDAYYEKRKDKLSQHNIDIGYCKNTFDVYRKSKIFLSLQDKNNYPSQSLFEAIYSDCAVIATDVGETREMLNDSNAILIQPLVMDLQSSIFVLLNNEKKRLELAEKAKCEVFAEHTVEKFSLYIMNLISND